MLHSRTLPPASTEETWREIERLVDEIAVLAGKDLTPECFYPQVLDRTVRALAADGAAVWSGDASNEIRCLCRTGEALGHGAGQGGDQQCVHAAWQRDEAHALKTPHACLLYVPVRSGPQRVGMIEVVLPPDVPQQVQQSGLRLLETVCELAGDYHRRRLVRELEQRVETEQLWREFLSTVHGDLDLEKTAYCLANDGRLLTACDRISVLVRRGKHCRAVAVSGVDRLERRARRVRLLEALATACARRQHTVWWPEEAQQLPPQVRGPLEAYLDESHVKQLGVVPVMEPCGDDEPHLAAVVVAEDAYARSDAHQFRTNVESLTELGGNALLQAIRLRRIPASRWLWSFGRRRTRKDARRWLRVVVGACAVVGIICALVFVPAPLRVRAHGTLQPKVRRHLFAPENAVVQEVLAKHGQMVHAGQPLLQLSMADLAAETTRAVGDLQVARQQLQSVRAKRFLARPGGTSDGAVDQLAAEEQRLNEQIDSLNRQLALLREREQALRILSPIEGQVLTWEPDELLASRPVQRGQKLLTVAAPKGPWILELRVSDRDVQHMLEARQKRGSDLPLRFALGTHPEATYAGRVVEVARRSELAEGDVPTVKVVATFDAAEVTPLRAGSEVVARIDCGTRSLGYVWLRDLWDAIRLRFFF